MKPIQTLFTLLLAVTLLISGCSGASEAKSPDAPDITEETTAADETPEAAQETTADETPETADEAAAADETPEAAEEVATGGQTYEVKMGSDTGQLKYVPEKLTIHPGDTVNFVMNKLAPHNVVFDSNGVPASAKALASNLSKNKLLSTPGATHTITFPEDMPKGEYSYYCQPHRGAGMNAKLIVE